MKENVVHLIMRKSFSELKRSVLDFNGEQRRGIDFRGQDGGGKSSLLYILATEFRMKRSEGYRVTYINDCKAFGETQVMTTFL